MTSPSVKEPRTLRISRRPLGIFALTLSPLLILATILFAQRGPQPAVLFLALAAIAIYAAITTIIFSQRITVRPDGIEIITLFRIRRHIRFRQITRTEIQTLGESARPIRAHIHTTDPDNPVITLSLKSLVREDAAWFCALPELKPVEASDS